MESKKDIRKRILEHRACMSPKDWEEKSRIITQKVVSHPFFLCADAIYCYVDYSHEVGTRSIIEHAWKAGKKVAVPKIVDDYMEFYYISDFSELAEGYRGILEPVVATTPARDEKTLIIMPGVAFDKSHSRIGYGKGYYDAYLQGHTDCDTIAICFEMQMVNQIPVQPHDFKPNIIITEENIYA